MSTEGEQLLRMVDSETRYKLSYADIRSHQIKAAEDRFKDRSGKISLLKHQADAAAVSAIRELDDLVPLLFAHTTYKSYPEGWMVRHKWDRLEKWLETVSTYPVINVDHRDLNDIDDWLARLEEAGTYVSCSSGTTGKCSMIAATSEDRKFARANAAMAFGWGTGIVPRNDFKVMHAVPVPVSPRNKDSRAAVADNFGNGDSFEFPGEPITIGQVSKMVALRRKVADGTATPNEIADYEAIAAAREADIANGMDRTIEALVENRETKMIISGQLGLLYQMTDRIRSLGFSRKDFHPETLLFLGGGPKGAVLPTDWREIMMDTFNVQLNHVFQYYGMQEINTTMPRCAAGRYHVPPWLMLLVLDKHGEALATPSDGEAEGRAGFFDLSLDGRWGGVISGDKIAVRYGKCDCGHEGPTVGYDIVRYSDLGDGDKITCAGTIDAYIRGIS